MAPRSARWGRARAGESGARTRAGPGAGGGCVEPPRRPAERGGRQLFLTPKELGMLELLLAADGAIVSAEELLERAWDKNADPFTNTIRVTVMRLRRKLGDPPLVETVARSGYRIP